MTGIMIRVFFLSKILIGELKRKMDSLFGSYHDRPIAEKERFFMEENRMKREVQEAVAAGRRALESLREAQKCLDSAKNWGIVDMIGGGFVSTWIKHSKMDDAAGYMEDAKSDMRRFQKELRDVNVSMDLRMEIGSFLSFADLFFDGLVADFLVQSKINEARDQVDEAIARVESLLVDLRRM